MLIMNALDEDQSVTACGNTFFFKAREIKKFHNPSIAWSIERTKGDRGFVQLPEELAHLAFLRGTETIESRTTPEEFAIVEQKRKEGVDSYVRRLRELVANAQVSLTRDLAKADFKHDPRFEYSQGDLKNMQELLKYQGMRADESKLRTDKIKDLEKKLEQSKLG